MNKRLNVVPGTYKKMPLFLVTIFLAVLMNLTVYSAEDSIPIRVLLNNKSEIMFDVPPQIIKNRTMVPMRRIFEALGADVSWDGLSRTVTGTKGDIKVVVRIDDTKAYLNSKEVTLDSPATIVNNRAMVPLRFIAESFNANVEWNRSNRIVSIYYGIGIRIYPLKVAMPVSDKMTFLADTRYSESKAYTFRILEGEKGGNITSEGIYTAPDVPGIYHVIVESQGIESDEMQFNVSEVIVYRSSEDISSGPKVLSTKARLEHIIPQGDFPIATYGAMMLENGKIITEGLEGNFIEIDLKGNIEQHTVTPSTAGFYEQTDDGTIWCYNPFDMKIFSVKYGESDILWSKQLPIEMKINQFDITSDGKEIYFTSSEEKNSKLYLYKNNEFTLIDSLDGSYSFKDVEVTNSGNIYIATTTGIYVLNSNNRLERIDGTEHLFCTALTSDENNNVYISSYGGMFKINSKREISFYSPIYNWLWVPYSVFYDNKTKSLYGVIKDTQQIAKYSQSGIEGILNTTGFQCPIALAVNSKGEIFVNCDEAGPTSVDKYGVNDLYCSGLHGFQPPGAGMAFNSKDELLYTNAGPSFDAEIVKITGKEQKDVIYSGDGAPAGIDIGPDGRIFFADYMNSKICRIEIDGSITVIKENIPYPVGLVVKEDGTIYVAAAVENMKGNPRWGVGIPRERILRITKDGEIEEILYLTGETITYFDVDDKGRIILPLHSRLDIYENGNLTTLASGFSWIRDVKVMKDGSYVISDYGNSTLYRLYME